MAKLVSQPRAPLPDPATLRQMRSARPLIGFFGLILTILLIAGALYFAWAAFSLPSTTPMQ